MKYYAVKSGRNTGIYETWAECEAQVKGYSGASYKSFSTLEDAEAFVNGVVKKEEPIVSVEVPKVDRVTVYTDGSYNNGVYSFGVCVVYPDGKEEMFNGTGDNELLAKENNIAGECAGALFAMNYLKEKGIKNAEIVYDYKGVGAYFTGEFKNCKSNCLNLYRHEGYSLIKDLHIKWTWVQGHSKTHYNDIVDALAKMALGLDTETKGILNYIKDVHTESHDYLNDLTDELELETR